MIFFNRFNLPDLSTSCLLLLVQISNSPAMKRLKSNFSKEILELVYSYLKYACWYFWGKRTVSEALALIPDFFFFFFFFFWSPEEEESELWYDTDISESVVLPDLITLAHFLYLLAKASESKIPFKSVSEFLSEPSEEMSSI